MGHDNKNTFDNVQKSHLKALFNMVLATDIEIIKYQITLTNKEEEIKGLKKYIKQCRKAQDIINSVVHYEILLDLYNTFFTGKETYFLSIMKMITHKDTIVKWDRTEKGFKLFQELQAQARAKSKEDYENRLKQQELIKKAREEGKKVEMVLVDGKLQPHIVEEKAN